jgi:hypothetical protein
VKTPRLAVLVGSVLVITLAAAGLITSDGGLDALLPALVLLFVCLSLYAIIRQGPKTPQLWDRKRIILSVTIAAAFAAAVLILVIVPSLQSEDSTMRTTGFMIAGVLLGSLAGGALFARKEHRLAQSSNSAGEAN